MRKGLTLIEMMVVLVVIAMMLSMVAPLFKATPSQTVRAAARQLGRDLELVRTRALSSKSAVEVVFNVSGNSYTAYLDDNRDGVFGETTAERQALAAGFPVTLAGGVAFGRGTAAHAPGDSTSSGANTFTNNRLTFGTNGITTPFGTAGTIYVVSTKTPGTVAAVSVSGAGSLKVWLYQGGGIWQ
jgi:prepilin-type N-terminal cleavage/methylation domain-containing protein